MKKNVKLFIKKLEGLKKIIDNNSDAFTDFNYKLYNLSYELYKNNNNVVIANMNENAFYNYCDDMYYMFKEDFNYQHFDVSINQVGRTSSMYLLNDAFERWNDKINFQDYNYNDLSLLLNYYDNESMVENLNELLRDLKQNNLYTLLKHCVIENIYIDNLIDDVENVKNNLLEVIKAYHFIMKYKKDIDDINVFINNYNFYIDDTTDLKKYNKQLVPSNFIDAIYEDTNCIVKKAGRYYKVWISYASQPIILITDDEIIK